MKSGMKSTTRPAVDNTADDKHDGGVTTEDLDPQVEMKRERKAYESAMEKFAASIGRKVGFD